MFLMSEVPLCRDRDKDKRGSARGATRRFNNTLSRHADPQLCDQRHTTSIERKLARCKDRDRGDKDRLRGGLVFKAHGLCVSVFLWARCPPAQTLCD